jgi:hypothetical protein
MNRTFSAITLQSAIAAAFIALSAPAFAATGEYWTEPVQPTFQSSASRAEVRSDAIAALRADARPGLATRSVIETPTTPLIASASREQIRAEAREASRLQLSFGYEGQSNVTPQKLEQVRLAGQRAVSPTLGALTR